MADPVELRVLPIGDRVEEELIARAGGAGAALGVSLCTFRELERRLMARVDLAPIDDLAAELLIAEVAEEAAEGSALARVAAEGSFARSFRALYHRLREGGSGARELGEVGRRTGGLAGRRAVALARVAESYEAALAARGLTDAAAARLALPGRIARGELPEELARAEAVVLEDVLDLSIARARLLEAIARRGKRVVVRVPAIGDAPELLAAIEQMEKVLADEAPSVETREKRYGTGALGGLGARLFGHGGEAPEAGAVRAIEADDPESELRAIVGVVRDRLDAGAPPDQVAIAVRGLGGWRERLGRALDEAEVPFRDRRGESADRAPPCALALGLLELAERGRPRGELALLFTSRYVNGGVPPSSGEPYIPPRRIGELLRAAGSRDDSGEGHAARLAAFAVRLAAPAELGGGRESRGLARQAVRVAEHLAQLRSALALPESGTAAEQLACLSRALDRLGVPTRCRALEERPGEPTGDGSEIDLRAGRALGRDQAALRALDAAGRQLVASAKRVSLDGRRLSRGRFRGLLAQVLSQATLRGRGARGGAVLIAEAGELAGRTIPHLVLAGCTDGQFPLRRAPEALFDEDDRRGFNRAAGRAVFRVRALEEPLGFRLACTAAARTLVATWSRADGRGQAQVRSPFVDGLLDAGQIEPERRRAAEVAPAADCRSEAALIARAAHLARGGAEVDGDPDARSLIAAVEADPRLGPRLGRVLAQRARPPEVQLTEPAARAALAEWIARGAAPLGPRVAWASSSSSLELYAGCPYRYFAVKVLGLEELEPLDDDLDAREGGSLLHDVARVVFQALAEAELLPLVGGARADREDEAARAACERALDRWQAARRTGPSPLWALRREQARASIGRLVEAERTRGGEVPIAFEAPFGFDGAPPLFLPSPRGEEEIAVRGRIDRIDRAIGAPGPPSIRVVDYKSNRVYDRLDPNELLRTQFQLPLYAAWSRARFGAGAVDGEFVSLRDGDRSRTLSAACEKRAWSIDALLELDGDRDVEVQEAAGAHELDERVPANVADRAWALFAALRAGRFDVRPHEPEACKHCAFATVCRVERPR